ncbi:MAG TPA: hypothetical protein DCE70_03475 [Acinetobacter sp.]|uniref:hypothetical protein n=1 Tax=Acinetobacter TaxID=469 RepID=UPI00054CB1F1|nr:MULTISPECIES: hypothetical protein [Acinetobacter]HAB42618.1 hypothetical protein [Acinetobacter sp.]
MDLFYILLNLNEFPADHLIYAELPWTLESKAISIDKNSKPELNLNINNIEYSYFLEIAMARKLLQVYSTNNVCLADTCQRIIEYALKQ